MQKVKVNLVLEGELEDDSQITSARIAELAPDVFVNYRGVDMDYDYLSIDDATATCEVEE